MFVSGTLMGHDDIRHGRAVLRWQQFHVCQWKVGGSCFIHVSSPSRHSTVSYFSSVLLIVFGVFRPEMTLCA